MIRLRKFLKPYIWLILLSIALLFGQANAELALPEYLSRIVDTGLQQSGVENAVPEAIRQAQMERAILFLSDAEQARVLGSYTLVEPGSEAARAYVEEYPAATEQAIYARGELSADEIEALNPLMAKGLLAAAGIQAMLDDPQQAAAAQQLGFDLSALPPGVDVFELLSNLPDDQRQQLQERLTAQMAALGDSMLVQSAVPVVRAEYEALEVDTARLQTNYILRTGGLMLLISLGAVTCAVAVGYLSALTASGAARDLRRAVFQKVENFSSAEFNRFSTASLITRSTNDITQIQMVVLLMLRMVVFAPIMGVGGIIRAMNTGSGMWWIIAVAVGLLLGMVAVVFSIALPKFRLIQQLVDRLNLVTRENLSGMMVIRAFNRQPFELDRFEKANQDLTGTNLFVSRVMVTMFPTMTVIMNGLSMAIIWVGSHQVAQANMQVGDMMAFLQYAMQIVFSFLMLSMVFIFLPRASVSGARIADVLETEPQIVDPPAARGFPEPFQGTVEFRGVSFRYPDAEENVLCGISFTARPGETTAFIGSTGSGKSTIVSLIPRFYDVTEGSVLVGGVDVRQVSQHALREKIGYIPQKNTLFSGTIESNLRYADEDASPELLADAAATAQATEFIREQPEGMGAEVSQGGANFSGGQKQRLAIARALVRRAPIYIFDDSSSALDYRTDAAMRRALKENTTADGQRSTVLIVTQRVAAVRGAEQIVVLDNGQIAGKGTHAELMESCETYREIAMSQLSLEELA